MVLNLEFWKTKLNKNKETNCKQIHFVVCPPTEWETRDFTQVNSDDDLTATVATSQQ